jgi:hypothetical protein
MPDDLCATIAPALEIPEERNSPPRLRSTPRRTPRGSRSERGGAAAARCRHARRRDEERRRLGAPVPYQRWRRAPEAPVRLVLGQGIASPLRGAGAASTHTAGQRALNPTRAPKPRQAIVWHHPHRRSRGKRARAKATKTPPAAAEAKPAAKEKPARLRHATSSACSRGRRSAPRRYSADEIRRGQFHESGSGTKPRSPPSAPPSGVRG